MLTILQRLVLGCVLLLAIVLGLGLSYRNTMRKLVALDRQVQSADRALLSLEKLRSSMREEQLLNLRLAGGESSLRGPCEAQQRESAKLDSAAADMLSSLDPAGSATVKALGQQRSLASATGDLDKLIATETSRRDALAGPALVQREAWQRALALGSISAVAGALIIAVLMILSVVRPLRLTARTARQIGQ